MLRARGLHRGRLVGLVLVAAGGLPAGRPAGAHPMGNFAICHYTRLQADRNMLRVRYILDMAEIPTVGEKELLDRNHDGTIDAAEKAAYLAAKRPELLARLELMLNGRPAVLQPIGGAIRLAPGAGGLETLKITLDLQAPLPSGLGGTLVAYKDDNYPARTGWKEIVADGERGVLLRDSSVPTADRSHELSVYPMDVTPPQDTEARFTLLAEGNQEIGKSGDREMGGQKTSVSPFPRFPVSRSSSTTPQDSFTQVIARRELTPGIMLAGLLIAFVFGAFHALSPGHGKAMVAAYLVGTRGTARHAALLGIIVTVTHTLGVFALGLLTLFASRYVVPEKLYPILSAISGFAVLAVGVWLFYRRLRGLSDDHHHHHGHDHSHSHSHSHTHSHEHVHDHDHEPTHSHEHAHLVPHPSSPIPENDHWHDASGHIHYHSDHTHHHDHAPLSTQHSALSTENTHHHHLPEGPVTARALLALGVSGGIVPCPSALVVLLAAIALHRIAFGMLLISAFSLGLATVLVAIGLLVVWARGWFDRIPSGGPLLRRLPVASAAMITLIGIVLIVRALGTGTP